MCDTQTGMALQLGGGIYQTIGSYYAAQGQKSALKAQAATADINARLAELTAQSALQRGEAEKQRSQITTSNIKGTQRAAMAANGVALDSDSAVNILTTTDTMGEIDANTIEANAVREAWGYRTQGANYRSEAIMARAGAKGISPFMSAASTALTAAGDVAMSGYKAKKAGALPADNWYNRMFKD